MTSVTVPVYEQVKTHVRTQIGSGVWVSGDPVPSESALMHQFGVSRMTINRALRELMAEGLVRRVQGSGTFVAELHQVSSQLIIRDIQEEVLERGHLHGTRVVTVETVRAPSALAVRMGLKAGQPVFHTVLIHLENGAPIQYEDRYVNPQAAPDYLKTDFTQTTPTRHLLDHAPLTQASYSIEATRPSAQEAKLLGIRRDEACLVMVRRTVSASHVASLARLVYPGTRYSFKGEFQA
jgi:GntR family histidine utilization transcriptional repressor